MRSGSVLVTGDGGLIGSHLVDRLLAVGPRVRVLDALLLQVHPPRPPDLLEPGSRAPAVWSGPLSLS